MELEFTILCFLPAKCPSQKEEFEAGIVLEDLAPYPKQING